VGGESFALLTPGHGYFIRQSVSGKTLLVTDHHGRYDDTFLDPDNLEIRTRCVGRNEGIASISDASQFFEHEIRYTPSFAILRGPFCERASTIGTPVPVERVPELHAVDELKYILVWPTRVEVADADRGELSRYATARHEDYGSFDVRFSRDGSRMAIPVIKYKGGSTFLDISPTPVSERIAVYDLNTLQIIVSIPLGPLAPAGDPTDFAFSPDGKQLAVLYRGVLRIFRVIP